MDAVGKRADPNESQVLQAIQDAIAQGTVPEDDFWTTKELSELTGMCSVSINNVVRELMVDGSWERQLVVRVSALDGRRCRVTGYRPRG